MTDRITPSGFHEAVLPDLDGDILTLAVYPPDPADDHLYVQAERRGDDASRVYLDFTRPMVESLVARLTHWLATGSIHLPVNVDTPRPA